MILTEPASPSTTAWLSPTVVVAYIGFIATLLTIAANWYWSRKDRKRELYAEALSGVLEYWEFPYAVRRRRDDEPAGERIRLSESMREVQAKLAFHQAWIRTEDKRTSQAFEQLVAQTRKVMGQRIHDAWERPPITDDAGMNISDVTRDGLDELQNHYLQAVTDHLSLWPAPLRRVLRSLFGSSSGAGSSS